MASEVRCRAKSRRGNGIRLWFVAMKRAGRSWSLSLGKRVRLRCGTGATGRPNSSRSPRPSAPCPQARRDRRRGGGTLPRGPAALSPAARGDRQGKRPSARFRSYRPAEPVLERDRKGADRAGIEPPRGGAWSQKTVLRMTARGWAEASRSRLVRGPHRRMITPLGQDTVCSCGLICRRGDSQPRSRSPSSA